MWAQLFFVLSQITRLTDRQTDGHVDGFLETAFYTVPDKNENFVKIFLR